MKKQPDSKYLKKFEDTAKHQGTYPFHPGNTDKIPAYNSSGLVKFKRILPPLRDEKIIDVQILKNVCPEIDFDNIKIEYGICTANKIRFRFKNVIELLKEFRELGLIPFVEIDGIYKKYNIKYHDSKGKIN